MDSGLHERDFYTWTQLQAAALRRLADRRENLDADLDLPMLIEEIEDLGSEQPRAVRSYLARMLQHLLLLAIRPNDQAGNHWRVEVETFRQEAARRYAPSMRQVVEPELDAEWMRARRLVEAKLERRVAGLPEACPFTLQELLDEGAPVALLVTRLRALLRS